MELKNNDAVSHSRREFGNLWASQSLIRDWASHPEWRSRDVLPCLYISLSTERKSTPRVQNSPKLGNTIRARNIFLRGFARDLLVEPKYVYPLITKFSDKLDEILRQSPKTTEQAIGDAAFAYYIFERIHPFLDGNGRIGRMIVKRILKEAGIRDPIFHDQRWYGGNRSPHLDSLERVNKTNNLAHLELFLAKALINRYDPLNEQQKHLEIADIIQQKSLEAQESVKGKKLSDIWDGFSGIPIRGNYVSQTTALQPITS